MSNHVTKIKTENGKLYAHTVFFDDVALDKVKALKDSKVLDKSTLGLHNDADIRIAFSAPSVFQYNIWIDEFPEAYKLLMSKDEAERMKGARTLALTRPHWVIQQRL